MFASNSNSSSKSNSNIIRNSKQTQKQQQPEVEVPNENPLQEYPPSSTSSTWLRSSGSEFSPPKSRTRRRNGAVTPNVLQQVTATTQDGQGGSGSRMLRSGVSTRTRSNIKLTSPSGSQSMVSTSNALRMTTPSNNPSRTSQRDGHPSQNNTVTPEDSIEQNAMLLRSLSWKNEQTNQKNKENIETGKREPAPKRVSSIISSEGSTGSTRSSSTRDGSVQNIRRRRTPYISHATVSRKGNNHPHEESSSSEAVTPQNLNNKAQDVEVIQNKEVEDVMASVKNFKSGNDDAEDDLQMGFDFERSPLSKGAIFSRDSPSMQRHGTNSMDQSGQSSSHHQLFGAFSQHCSSRGGGDRNIQNNHSRLQPLPQSQRQEINMHSMTKGRPTHHGAPPHVSFAQYTSPSRIPVKAGNKLSKSPTSTSNADGTTVPAHGFIRSPPVKKRRPPSSWDDHDNSGNDGMGDHSFTAKFDDNQDQTGMETKELAIESTAVFRSPTNKMRIRPSAFLGSETKRSPLFPTGAETPNPYNYNGSFGMLENLTPGGIKLDDVFHQSTSFEISEEHATFPEAGIDNDNNDGGDLNNDNELQSSPNDFQKRIQMVKSVEDDEMHNDRDQTSSTQNTRTPKPFMGDLSPFHAYSLQASPTSAGIRPRTESHNRTEPLNHRQAANDERFTTSILAEEPIRNFKQSPANFKQSPATFKQSPANFKQSPANFRQSPTNFKQSPAPSPNLPIPSLPLSQNRNGGRYGPSPSPVVSASGVPNASPMSMRHDGPPRRSPYMENDRNFASSNGIRLQIGNVGGMEQTKTRKGMEGINTALKGAGSHPMRPGQRPSPDHRMPHPMHNIHSNHQTPIKTGRAGNNIMSTPSIPINSAHKYPGSASSHHSLPMPPGSAHRGIQQFPIIQHRKSPPGSKPRGSFGDNRKENESPNKPRQRRNPCNCKKSKCLKLYCECFAAELYCDGCNCVDCNNTKDHEAVRAKAIKDTKAKNQNAFGNSVGCRCKKSACLKKYCECFEAGNVCSLKCKCVDCQNYIGSQALIDRRRKIKDHKGAEMAMRSADEYWKGGSRPDGKMPMRNPVLMFPSPAAPPRMGHPPHVRMHHHMMSPPAVHGRIPPPHFMNPHQPIMVGGPMGYSPVGMQPTTPYSNVMPRNESRPAPEDPSQQSRGQAPQYRVPNVPTPKTPASRRGFDPHTKKKKGTKEETKAYFGKNNPSQAKNTALAIFSFLSNDEIYNASLVSKDWSKLSLDEELWQFD